MRNLIVTLGLAMLVLLASSARAQVGVLAAQPFEEGKDYVVMPNAKRATDAPGIEAVTFFWYGCGHCYNLDPLINQWAANLPSDVHFVRYPALFGGAWNIHGQLYLTLEAMGVEEKLHSAVFEAIQRQNRRLLTPDETLAFLQEHNIDPELFTKTFTSFGVKSQVQRISDLAKSYNLTGVPVMIIDGKYRFDISSAGGPERMLQLADFLIAKERKALKLESQKGDAKNATTPQSSQTTAVTTVQ